MFSSAHFFQALPAAMRSAHQHVARYHEWYVRRALRAVLLSLVAAVLLAWAVPSWTWPESWALFLAGMLSATVYLTCTQWMRRFAKMARYYDLESCRTEWSLHGCKDTAGPHATAVRHRADMLRQKARELRAAVSMY